MGSDQGRMEFRRLGRRVSWKSHDIVEQKGRYTRDTGPFALSRWAKTLDSSQFSLFRAL